MLAYLRHFALFLRDIIKSRHTIYTLSKQDFKARYLGSHLGVVWAFVQPVFNILIMWFVFQVGFRSAPVDNFPFILWLMAGMIPWTFFSEGVMSATSSIVDHSFLVKKVVFRVSVLPIVRILSTLAIHLFFIVLLIIIYILYGHYPDIYTLQAAYYLFAGMVLILGIAWITSSLLIFLKDVGQIVSIVIQFCFWLTPVFWTIKILPQEYHTYIKLNPAYYLIEGYRNSLIYKRWFWEDMGLTLYFWSITIFIFIFGALLFRRLRPHFADVL